MIFDKWHHELMIKMKWEETGDRIGMMNLFWRGIDALILIEWENDTARSDYALKFLFSDIQTSEQLCNDNWMLFKLNFTYLVWSLQTINKWYSNLYRFRRWQLPLWPLAWKEFAILVKTRLYSHVKLPVLIHHKLTMMIDEIKTKLNERRRMIWVFPNTNWHLMPKSLKPF